MTMHTELEAELERRLTTLEHVEVADPAHAALSGATLTLFLGTVAGIVAVAWLAVAL